MKPFYNHDEITAWSLNDQASIRSAQAYLTGLYAMDEGEYAGLANLADKKTPYPYSDGSVPPLLS